MDYILLILSFILILVGIAGSLLPVLPGLPISWIGLLCFYLIKDVNMNYWALGITLIITLIISILDYLIPAQGTKRFGGTRYGIWGTNIGLIVGIFAPIPFGFIIGPFIGAFIGELLFDLNDHKRALKAASGSLAGFFASTLLKFIVAVSFLGFLIQQTWVNRNIWF